MNPSGVQIEEKEGQCLITQKAEIGGRPVTLSIHLDHSVTSDEAEKACLELFKEMSLTHSKQQQGMGDRTLEKQQQSVISSANNVLDIIHKSDSSLDPSLLADFLMLSTSHQQEKLSDQTFLSKLQKAVEEADQAEIRNYETADTLLHQLVESDAPETRELALVCLKCGADPNGKNRTGASALHFAAAFGDEKLIQELLNRGAVQSMRAGPSLLSPLETALYYEQTPCAVLLALANPVQEINGVSPPAGLIQAFLGKVEVSTILKMLDTFSQQNKISDHADTLWKSVYDITTRSVLRQGVGFDSEVIACWLLDHHVESESSLNHQCEVMSWFGSRMIGRKLQRQGDLSALNTLRDSHWLSSLILKSGGWFLWKVGDPSFTLNAELKSEIDKLSLETSYVNLHRLALKFQEEQDLSLCTKIFIEIEASIDDLKNKRFQGIKQLEHALKNSMQAKIKDIERYKKIIADLEAGSEIEEIDGHSPIYQSLINTLLESNSWDQLLQLHQAKKTVSTIKSRTPLSSTAREPPSRSNLINVVAFHFLFDKLLIKESKEYEGLHSPLAGRATIQAIDRVTVLDSDELLPLRKVIDHINRKLKPLIEEFIQLNSHDHNETQWVKKIGERINNLQEGESLLIPMGVAEHATCVLITHTENQTFQLSHYNTGDGLDNHYRFLQSIDFQTFDTISHIPLHSMNHADGWGLIYEVISRKNIDHLYRCITHTIGKGGEREPPSDHREDYEAIQLSGTCGIQSIMAFLRHQIMLSAEGSPSERQALYKIYKSQLFTQFYEDNSQKLNQTIRNHAVTVLKKLRATNSFIQIASDEESFKKTMRTLANLLEQPNDDNEALLPSRPRFSDEAEETKSADESAPPERNSTLSRYAILRQASLRLSLAWLKDPTHPPSEKLRQDPGLQLAFAKFDHYSATLRNAQDQLEDHFKKTIRKVILH